MIYPKPLKEGDAIAIVSPASKIDGRLVDGACATIRKWGFQPIVSPHCKGEYGSFSGTKGQRLEDLRQALSNSHVRAILCSRGGYGTVQLLDQLPTEIWTADPKWMIGFSDISALHAAAHHAGVASIHASMCKHLTDHPDDECSHALLQILTGRMPDYTVAGNPRNRCGKATGSIAGGNLAVLAGLFSTPFNLLEEDHILFIEDIAEAIYRVERMLYTLRLNGVFEHTKALIVGQFTDYKPSADHACMYDMIEDMVAGYDFPVAFDFPIGHVDCNLPIIEGAIASIEVEPAYTRLFFEPKKPIVSSWNKSTP